MLSGESFHYSILCIKGQIYWNMSFYGLWNDGKHLLSMYYIPGTHLILTISLWSRYPHVTDDKAETELLNFPKVIQSIRARMEARHPSLESVLQGTLWHHLSFYTCNYIYILSIPYVAIMFKHLFSNVALHNDWNS